MPIKHAALKQLRKDRKRAPLNRAQRSELKTFRKEIADLLDAKKGEDVRKQLPAIMKQLDQAAARGVMAKNAASRAKSRIMLRLAKISPAKP